jgi:hypothetical protein
MIRHDEERRIRPGADGLGLAGRGEADMAWRGQARPGQAWRGMARTGSRGTDGTGKAGSDQPDKKNKTGKLPKTETEREQKMSTKKTQEVGEVVIDQLGVGVATVWIKGMTPLFYNAMSAKVKGELLLPKGRKTTAEKATTLKHDPIEEYRTSVYRRISTGATRLIFPATAFKNAAIGAVRHINAGVTMVQMKQLIWVVGDTVDVYGVPQMHMGVVRSADMNKTPDIRTRAILPEWCCCIKIQYVKPNLNETAVARLLEAGGMLNGVGDFRQEKGKGNYGQFQIANKEDCDGIMKSGGIKAQDAALASPEMYDAETEELFNWYKAERDRRGK